MIAANISAMAQRGSIELHLKGKTLLEVLTTVENQTDYKFVYNNKEVDVTRKINIDTEFESIDEFTSTILGDYNVTVRGNNIIITPKTSFAGTNVLMSQQPAQRNVIGQIVDAETGESIIGANIWIRESARGTVTDIDGNFSIPISNNSTVLVVTYIGYEELVIEVGSRTNLGVIQLKASQATLDEVVVVGYGTQTKESVIGAISTVSIDELKVPSSKISNVLAGRLAGVVSVTRTGEPGAGSEFYIRGISTFGANRNPLVLVDGIERSLDLVDPEDIESFSVLKDATATAVYGVRGANGVILITTRNGMEGRPKVNLRVEKGFTGPTKLPKMVNSVQFAELYNEASNSNYYTSEVIDHYMNGTDPDLYPNVDWVKSLYDDLAQNTRVNVNISGGGSLARYYIAGSLYDEGSIFKTEQANTYDSSLNYRKINFRANVDLDLTSTTILNRHYIH